MNIERNAKFVSEEELDSMRKTHTILTSEKYAELTNDLLNVVEKGIDVNGISQEEYDNLKEMSERHSSAEPVTMFGASEVLYAIPNE